MSQRKVKVLANERVDLPDLSRGGQAEVLYMSPGNYKAYMRIMDPTYGMSKKEKRLFKLLYES